MAGRSRKMDRAQSDSGSSSEEGPDGYEHDDFVVPDDYEDPVSDSEHLPSSVKKHHRRLHRGAKAIKPDPEDFELAVPSMPTPAKDKQALSHTLFTKTEETPAKRRKMEAEPDLVALVEDGEILESKVMLAEGEVSTAMTAFGTSTIYTPREPEPSQMAFEPSDIIARYATSEDEIVRVTDVPERLQSAFERRLHASDAELDSESDWLLQRLMMQKAPSNLQELKGKVRTFLQLYRADKLDVPYIAAYRLHILKPELTAYDLWDLHRWDKDWAFVHEQKTRIAETLAGAAKAAKEQSAGRPPDPGQKVLITGAIPEDVCELLTKSSPDNFISELSDLTQFTDIFVQMVKDIDGGRRVMSRKQMLSDARRGRLDEFALKAGLTPIQFSANLKAGKKVHWPPRTPMKPQDLAFEYMSGEYNEEFRVLHTVCMLMKGELAATPAFRSFIRKEYLGIMRIITSPTERGKQSLDIFHPAYRVKHMGHGKSVETFEGDLWAEVAKCEGDGLIRVELRLPWSDHNDRILAKLKPLYLSDDFEDETEADWNNFRQEVLKNALTEVYEALSNETRKVLMYRAEEFVLQECCKKYAEMLARPPFLHPDEPGPVKAFALVADPSIAKFGKVALAALDKDGEVEDTAEFTALIKGEKEEFKQIDEERHQDDRKKLQEMLVRLRPAVIVIGANCLHAMQLRRVVVTNARLMSSEGFIETEVHWPVDPTALLQHTPQVLFLDLQVSKLFAESHRGKRMLPDFDPLVRQAVSLGRSLQAPINELLGLWVDPNENLTPALKLHRLQKLIPEKQLLTALEEEAVKAACHRGADLNRMIDHPHQRPPLSFICGLGPIKAHSLMEKLTRTGTIYLRTELLTRQLVTKLVYQNCVGFVVIEAPDRTDPLDRTRIHPEYYDLAKKIAASALENVRDEDESNIEKAMRAPSLVREVDLDNYACYLESRGRKNMKDVLEMIVQEFAQPFHVQDAPCTDLTGEELMYALSGESLLTLRKGLLAQGYVTSNSDGRIRCRLESGLDAMVVADMEMAEKLRQGSSIRGRILEVQVNVKSPEVVFFNIRLSVKQDDIVDHVKFKDDILGLMRLDETAFIMDDADWTEKSLMEDEHQLGQKYVPRVVSHPKYRNVGLKTACSELEPKERGDYLFRPSSRGTDHLTCTMKFHDFVYCHLDIIEEGKPADNMLGTRFKIGDETYESLQEIVERYIVPITALTKEAVAHHKFKDVTGHTIEYIEILLRSEKRAAPSSIPYYFTVTPHYPQFLVLCYLPKERIVREYIKVKPRGLFFHECYHPNINFLISWFKKHYSDSTYQGQLLRSKPPVISTENRFAIPGKILAEVQQASVNSENKTPDRAQDTPLRRTPGYGEMTPFNKTPHIGNQEWSGGAPLKQTPRADDWEAERNFDSYVPTSETLARVEAGETGWGAPPKPQEQLKKSQAGWGASQDSWGSASSKEVTWGATKDISDSGKDWGSESSWSGDDSRGRGRGQRRAGRGCFKCGEEGHMSRDCTKPGAAGGSRNCYKCGEEGHMSRDCPKAGSGSRACYNCGKEGHMSKDCTEERKPREFRGERRGRGRRGGGDSHDSGWKSGTVDWGSSGGSGGWGPAPTGDLWGSSASAAPCDKWGASATSTSQWGESSAAPAASSSQWDALVTQPASGKDQWGAPSVSAPAGDQWGNPSAATQPTQPASDPWSSVTQPAAGPSDQWGAPRNTEEKEAGWGPPEGKSEVDNKWL